MKNFTNNFKQFTSRLSARWLIMALMMLVGTSSAWGWSYKTAADSWNCKGNTGWSNETLYTTPTGNTTQSLSVVMLTNPGSGFNILRADNCNEWNGSDQNHCLYVGLTGTASSNSSTIVRATAYWYSNGLYSKYTVVIPAGKIYIKPTGGSAISMTKNTYTYTAELTLTDAKTFDLYADAPSATIENQWGMPSAGKPTSVRLNYTGLTSPYKYVRVSYNLKTNRITFTEMDPPCTTPDPPTFDPIPDQCGSYTLPTEDKYQVSVNWYNANGNKITSVAQSGTYYAEAVDGTCVSASRTPVQITINTIPNISISGNNSAVLYEDVELTAATDGTSISWEITEEDGSLSSTTGNSVTLTSSSAGTVTVTATATLGSCTATDTHEVEFSAENCADVASNDIQITFIHPNDKGKACQYWGLGKLTYYIGSTKHVHDFGNSTTAGAEGNLTIPDLTVDKITGVRLDAAYDYTQCTAYDTITDLAKGYHYTLTLSDAQQNSGNAQKSVTLSKVSLTEAPPITAPAAKTISVSTTDGEGNIIFSGQVVKTGCDATNEYGFQYSSDEQTWTTVKVGENAAAGTAISNNTVKGLDGTYYVRAYITNDNSTQYGAIEAITVSTKKYPITTVTLTHVKNQAGDTYSTQELANLIYCVGDIVWFKLEQDGSNFQYYEWISYPGTGLEGMYYGGMFKLKITRSGNVRIRLRNDANVDLEGNPTWIESNLLEFNTHPEPTAPTISFAKATICSNDDVGATLTLGATVSGQAYELWKYANDDDTEGSKVANVATLNCTENNQVLQFSGIKTAGKYFVKTYYTAFCNTVIANSSYVTLTVVNAEDVSISIDPAAATTTPWMPVKLTISATDDYTLEVPDGVEFSQNGNNVSVKIPLPEGATGGEGQYENVSFPQDATTSYTVTANLVSIGGEDNPCAVPAEATITLTPYVEECTIGH